ncbi:MAG: hypothetical protein ABJG78_12660 [Cyclobacteriaceae bacterium]
MNSLPNYLQSLASIIVIVGTVFTLIRKTIDYWRYRNNTKGLHPFFSLREIKNYTKYYVPSNGQTVAPSKDMELTDSFIPKENLIDLFLNRAFKPVESSNKYFMILGGSGMGKTALLLNLYLKYKKKYNRTYDIRLFPLGFKGVDEKIAAIPEFDQKNSILLLDAFDEDPLIEDDDYNTRIRKILELTYSFRIIIITCRTQFFPKETEEPDETGVVIFGTDKGTHKFQKFYVSPFDEKNIRKFLRKKFKYYFFNLFALKKRAVAREIISKSKFLMVRPLLLSYIDDILKSVNFGLFTSNAGRNSMFQYSFQIYEVLINKWILRESNFKKSTDERKEYRENLYKASQLIAMEIYQHSLENQSLKLDAETVESIGIKSNIKLSELELKSRSLLNRDSAGLLKFSHKSILEYFLALELVKSPIFAKDFRYIEMNQAKSFYNEMYYHKEIKNSLDTFKLNSRFKVKMKGASMKALRFVPANQLVNLPFDSDLEGIEAKYMDFKDIRPFEVFDTITFLNLSNNSIEKVNRLCMINLRSLILKDNRTRIIENLTLPNLRELDLTGSSIHDFSFLRTLPSLRELYLLNSKVDNDLASDLVRQYNSIKFHFDKSVELKQGEIWYEYMKKEELSRRHYHSKYPRFPN